VAGALGASGAVMALLAGPPGWVAGLALALAIATGVASFGVGLTQMTTSSGKTNAQLISEQQTIDTSLSLPSSPLRLVGGIVGLVTGGEEGMHRGVTVGALTELTIGLGSRLTSRSGARNASPPHLSAGQQREKAGLDAWGIPKNTIEFRPTATDMADPLFKNIVGKAEFTPAGLPKGTIIDVIATNGYTEIKTGASIVNSSYQLRLQVYYAQKNNITMTIATTRAINPTFKTFLTRWGVQF